ncbi:MAG: hypothetical protein RQ736_02105 [Thiogranum sp.]|nr:hypothetical protein [Thiogranum sp.]
MKKPPVELTVRARGIRAIILHFLADEAVVMRSLRCARDDGAVALAMTALVDRLWEVISLRIPAAAGPARD